MCIKRIIGTLMGVIVFRHPDYGDGSDRLNGTAG
jgi:hypothetical protein